MFHHDRFPGRNTFRTEKESGCRLLSRTMTKGKVTPYAVLLTKASTSIGSSISESAFGMPVSILAFCCLASRRFEALSICFCCLAFSFVCLPKLYMDLPIFKLLFLSFFQALQNMLKMERRSTIQYLNGTPLSLPRV